MTGYATLAFTTGQKLSATFRVDPDSIDWTFAIQTNVINTIGGRVVQVVGATLSDMVITGRFGEGRSKTNPQESWQLAQKFISQIRQMMAYQANDSTDQTLMHPPAIFTYPPLNYQFSVYIKDFSDPDGGAITMSNGKFSHGYSLTLFVVQNATDPNSKGASVLNIAKGDAINSYINRLTDGIGWKPTSYDGNWRNYYQGEYDTTTKNVNPGIKHAVAWAEGKWTG